MSTNTSTALKQTPLHAEHCTLGAHMVDFGGWDMPLHYGSQIQEHHTVRQHVGLFDVSHMRVTDLCGPDAQSVLLRLIANDIRKTEALPGKAIYSVMLNEQGGVIDDLIVYRVADEHFRVVLNAGCADKDIAWIKHCLQQWQSASTLEVQDVALLALQGPEAWQTLWSAYPNTKNATENLVPFASVQVDQWFIGSTGYTGENGCEIMVPANQAVTVWRQLLAAGARPCGLGARDTLRLEAGMALYGHEMDETVSPLDAGLRWTLALKQTRDFVGKEALLAHEQKAQTLGLLLEDRGVLRAQLTVHTAHGDGVTTSGTFAPTLGKSIALARLPMSVNVGDQVTVTIRDKALAARVVKPPFARLGQSLL